MQTKLTDLETQLNDFDPALRAAALAALLDATQRGEVAVAPAARWPGWRARTATG